jgi:hypothetical protein
MKSIQDLTEEQQKFIAGQRLLKVLAKLKIAYQIH